MNTFKNYLVLIAAIFCFVSPLLVVAQPTITFVPSDGTTITETDVDNTLYSYGLTRIDSFHAVSNANIVGE